MSEKGKVQESDIFIGKLHTDWVRREGSKFGVDIPKYILGDLLVSITQDDANEFIFLPQNDPFINKQRNFFRQNMLQRITWEIDCPEVPKDIKERLKSVKSEIKRSDWSIYEQFLKSYTSWDSVRNFVSNEIRSKKDYKAAYDYNIQPPNEMWSAWIEYYNLNYGK